MLGEMIGKIKGKVVEARESIFYKTSSEKLSRLNNIVGIYEHHLDEPGNFKTKIWGWS